MTVLYMSFIQINILFGLNWDYFRSLCDFDLKRGFKGVEFEVLLEKLRVAVYLSLLIVNILQLL